MKRNDYILTAILFILCVLSIVIFQNTSKPGDVVVIKLDGAIYAKYDLNVDTSIRMPESGNDFNVITIKNHSVCITDADCPDKICVRHSAINKDGETIVCLPHKLSVVIESVKNNIDGIAY